MDGFCYSKNDFHQLLNIKNHKWSRLSKNERKKIFIECQWNLRYYENTHKLKEMGPV